MRCDLLPPLANCVATLLNVGDWRNKKQSLVFVSWLECCDCEREDGSGGLFDCCRDFACIFLWGVWCFVGIVVRIGTWIAVFLLVLLMGLSG